MLAGLLVGALKAALTLPFIGRYGWNRDELYFLEAAKHPALGYVDFPPLTAWIGWLVHAVAGNSLVGLRLTSLATSVAAIVLVALMARELGGSRWAQGAAAGLFALTPYILAASTIFHPTWFDMLAWTALLYLVLRVLGRPQPRLWPLVGVVAGIGLEAKYTLAMLIIALFAALLVTKSRSLLVTAGPWVAASLAFVLMVPNLVWQATHGWPSVEFFESQNEATRSDTSPATYFGEQLMFFGLGLISVIVGVVWLWRRPRLRPLAIVPVLVFALYFLEGGRSYYPMPAYSLPLAAGCVAIAGWLRPRRWWKVSVVSMLALCQVGISAFAIPQVVPVKSTAEFARSSDTAIGILIDEIGWPELTQQTARAWRRLTPAERSDAVVIAGNYGEAGALALYGPAQGLPQPLSGHLSWQYWRPRRLPQRHVIAVGWSYGGLGELCRSSRVVDVINNRWNIANEERGRTIAFCELRRPLGEMWDEDIVRNEL
jgi:4-amino-4-deoxy-L-arabinose transferase-like glycosyltransferase